MIKRDAFLYMDGSVRNFAQCSTCLFWVGNRDRCRLHPDSAEIFGTASCGLYVHGTPTKNEKGLGLVTAIESGLVDREVRCENCRWFHAGECGLYGELNRRAPAIFKLNTKVHPRSCCNAQEPT